MRKNMLIPVVAAAVVLLLVGKYTLLRGGSNPPAVGSPAPDFTLSSQEGKPVTLSSLRGQWVVLYFYPKDFTSGCTVEAHNFQRDLAEYQKRNAIILGVSVQDAETHKQFCTKEGLNFKLLADTSKEVSKSYDSITNLGIAKLSSRHTFLIDPAGIVRKVWLDVNVQKHSQEVLTALDDFQKETNTKP
ncbi:MAG TPA: peroxiredoxin [Candidatus Acidoferrum sp.]